MSGPVSGQINFSGRPLVSLPAGFSRRFQSAAAVPLPPLPPPLPSGYVNGGGVNFSAPPSVILPPGFSQRYRSAAADSLAIRHMGPATERRGPLYARETPPAASGSMTHERVPLYLRADPSYTTDSTITESTPLPTLGGGNRRRSKVRKTKRARKIRKARRSKKERRSRRA